MSTLLFILFSVLSFSSFFVAFIYALQKEWGVVLLLISFAIINLLLSYFISKKDSSRQSLESKFKNKLSPLDKQYDFDSILLQHNKFEFTKELNKTEEERLLKIIDQLLAENMFLENPEFFHQNLKKKVYRYDFHPIPITDFEQHDDYLNFYLGLQANQMQWIYAIDPDIAQEIKDFKFNIQHIDSFIKGGLCRYYDNDTKQWVEKKENFQIKTQIFLKK